MSDRSGGRGGRVVVVGDVIDDVVVRPEGPVTHDSDTRAQIVRREGGSAANMACWLATTGVPVTFVGRVGAADVERHTAALQAFGVDALLVGDAEQETGRIIILLDDDGARTMFTDRGANLGLLPQDVPAGLVEGAALLHLSGYSLVEPGVRSTAVALLARAREAGVPVSVDPSSASFLREVGAASFLAWTAGSALCFPNSDEARVLTGADTAEEAAVALSRSYGLVAVTCGAHGAVVAAGGLVLGTVAPEPVQTVDSTGAGDAFCAGFVGAWVSSDPGGLVAGEAGARLARDAVGRMGARPPRSADRPTDDFPRVPTPSQHRRPA
ncbi:carbohydrate kinase family protein [Actinotalea sp. Marseille-Q4924]|uniref:carbohydrate kinase family protein n=1 Tax=Actinotalea sp. Marseille-Q4924 TaxID=2866571 RepID=UPI001CE4AA9D|nr:PfkB family carbohydrate kinase [Actinotalea sp. Marseille-Q4924]